MKKTVSKFDAEKLELVEVKIVKASINCREDFDFEALLKYHPSIKTSLRVSMETKSVRCALDISVETGSSNSQPECSGNFLFHFYFEVSNLPELLEVTEDESNELDPALAIAIAGVAYSTARGILISRFQGTVFSLFILPIVNPAKLL